MTPLVLGLAFVLLGQSNPPVSVAAPNGTFTFTDLRVTKCGRDVCLKGTLNNETAADWGMVIFDLSLFDKTGQPLVVTGLLGSTIDLFDVPRGAKKVDTRIYGANLKSDIGTYRIAYKSGKYPAHYTFALTKPSVSPALTHEDESIRIIFSIPSEPKDNPISFRLTNKTDNPIVVDWNQISYVDADGTAHRIIHKGVRLIERDQPMPPSTVPPNATLEDFIYPSDMVEMMGGRWIQQMLFPDAPLAGGMKGKTVSIFLPVEVNGAKKNYNFVLTIADVKM